MNFPQQVKKFCANQHYTRAEAGTSEEFSQIAFRLYGVFTTMDLNLEQIVTITNCMILARTSLMIADEKPIPQCNCVPIWINDTIKPEYFMLPFPIKECDAIQDSPDGITIGNIVDGEYVAEYWTNEPRHERLFNINMNNLTPYER